MSLTGWLVIAVVCVVAGLVLLVLDRRRPRRAATPTAPGNRPVTDPSEAPTQRGAEGDDPDEPGSLFRPNTPP